MNNLPELPPRHYWEDHGTKADIFAEGTVWYNKIHLGDAEPVYRVEYGKIYVWKGGQNGKWEVHSREENMQDAINIMAALCWLGTADYELENE